MCLPVFVVCVCVCVREREREDSVCVCVGDNNNGHLLRASIGQMLADSVVSGHLLAGMAHTHTHTRTHTHTHTPYSFAQARYADETQRNAGTKYQSVGESCGQSTTEILQPQRLLSQKGPRFNSTSVLLSLQKGCGLWTLSCDFVHHFLLKH